MCFDDAGFGIAVVESARGLLKAEYRPRDPGDGLDKALAAAASDHGLRGCPAYGVLARGSYQVQQLQAPNVLEEEMREAVHWRLKDLVSFPIEAAVTDVIPVPSGPSQRENRMVYGVATERAYTEELGGAVAASGLRLMALDIPELAVRNLAARLPQQGAGIAVLAIDRDEGLLTISREGTLYLARTLEMGAVDLAADDGQVADRLALELQRSLDYYDSQLYGAPPTSVLVLPLAEVDHAALVERLDARLRVPIDILHLESLLEAGVLLSPAQEQRTALAVGAALRGIDGGRS